MNVLSVDETIQLIQIGHATPTTCSPKLSEGPWVWDAEQPAYGPGASMADHLPAGSPHQGILPVEYQKASAA